MERENGTLPRVEQEALKVLQKYEERQKRLQSIRNGKPTRRDAIIALGSVLLTGATIYGTYEFTKDTGGPNYDTWIGGRPPTAFLNENLTVDLRNVPMFDSGGARFSVESIDQINHVSLPFSEPFIVREPLLVNYPTEDDEDKAIKFIVLSEYEDGPELTAGYVPLSFLTEDNEVLYQKNLSLTFIKADKNGHFLLNGVTPISPKAEKDLGTVFSQYPEAEPMS